MLILFRPSDQVIDPSLPPVRSTISPEIPSSIMNAVPSVRPEGLVAAGGSGGDGGSDGAGEADGAGEGGGAGGDGGAGGFCFESEYLIGSSVCAADPTADG